MSTVDQDLLDYMARSIEVIRADENLRKLFLTILSANPTAQHSRVSALTQRLIVEGAPKEVLTFVKLLSNDQVASAVLKALAE
jgi:hypothetical protein